MSNMTLGVEYKLECLKVITQHIAQQCEDLNEELNVLAYSSDTEASADYLHILLRLRKKFFRSPMMEVSKMTAPEAALLQKICEIMDKAKKDNS